MFYVYLHTHHDAGYPVVFYVGKGQGKRAWRRDSRSKMWHNVVAKHGCDVVIHSEGLTEEQAFELETRLIQNIGRRDLGTGPLVNLSNGGQGGKNGNLDSIARSAEGQRKSWSEKGEMRKAALREAWKTRKNRSNENQKKAASEWNKARWADPEKRKAHSEKLKMTLTLKKTQNNPH